VPADSDEAPALASPAVPELRSSLDAKEQVGDPRAGPGIHKSREGVDDILRRHLAPMMELDALSEGKRPGQAVTRGHPELGECGGDAEGLVELDQAVEKLLADRETINVAQAGRIERGGIVAQGPAIDTA